MNTDTAPTQKVLANPVADPHIVAVVLTCDQRDHTLSCIEKLKASDTQGFELNIVVWDNGSQDGTREALTERFPKVPVGYSEVNLGTAAGRNKAAEIAFNTFNPTHLLFIDNDTEIDPHAVGHLLRYMQEHPGVGQTAAKLRYLRDRERLQAAGGSKIGWVLADTSSIGAKEIDRGQYSKPLPCIAPTTCMLVRRDAFAKIGGFDTVYDPYGIDDLDLSLRVQSLGLDCMYVPEALCYHLGSQTFERGKYSAPYVKHKWRNWKFFLKRHGPWWGILGFYTIGIPVLTLRALWREGRRGNLVPLARGLLLGSGSKTQGQAG